MSKAQKNDTLERVNKQLEPVERIISELLEGVELRELSNSERLNFAIKFMGLHIRVLMLRQRSEVEGPDDEQQEFLEKLMQQMRGDDL